MDRIFRVLKETRGQESRYFPQYKWKRWSGMWFFNLVDGGNDWQYFVGKTTWIDMESHSFIPLMFETQAEAEEFLERRRQADNPIREVVA